LTTSTNTSCYSTKAPERIDFLYTDIGRGHPFYLDGIVESLPHALRGDITSVFTATRGIPHGLWRAAKAAYRLGSSAGGENSPYSRLRKSSSFDAPGPLLRYAGRPLLHRFAERTGPLVVAHPILTALLRSHPHLIYQHGEIVVPPECLVKGQHITFVPTEEAADVFRTSATTDAHKIIVTGLCIEPSLADMGAKMVDQRQQRFANAAALTGGFFSSGAEPSRHVTKLVTAAMSAVLRGGSAVVVAKQSGSFARRTTHVFETRGLTLSTDSSQIPIAGALLCTYCNRAELDALTREHVPSLDYFVSPAHERTNWAVGLGLPMFIVDPSIGTFAPLNRAHLIAHGVAEALTDTYQATTFGRRLESLWKTDMLAQRSKAGWGKYPIDGFKNIANWVT